MDELVIIEVKRRKRKEGSGKLFWRCTETHASRFGPLPGLLMTSNDLPKYLALVILYFAWFN